VPHIFLSRDGLERPGSRISSTIMAPLLGWDEDLRAFVSDFKRFATLNIGKA